MPAVIIKPRLTFATHMEALVGTYHSIGRENCSFKNSTGLSANQMLYQGRLHTAPQTEFQLSQYFRQIFPLMHKFETAFVIVTHKWPLRDEWSELPNGAVAG